MSQLVVQNILNQLPEVHRQFVSLRVGQTPINKIQDTNFVKSKLVDILTKTSFEINSPMANDPVILSAQTESLFNELKGKYSTLTLAEVSEAFRRGIRGEFGPYFGMCAKSYHQFIKFYFELPERSKGWSEYLEMIETTDLKSKPVYFTPEKLKQIAISDFENYKKSGRLPYCPHATYNIINELIGVEVVRSGKNIKTLVPDDAMALELLNKAKECVKKPVKSKSHWEYSVDGNYSTNLEFTLKRFYLIAFFNELIRTNKDLEL